MNPEKSILLSSFFAAILLVACTPSDPTSSNDSGRQDRSLLEQRDAWCDDVQELNEQGLAMAPGTAGAARLQAQAGIDRDGYARMWRIAKLSTNPVCRGIF